LLNKPTEEAV